MTRLENFRKSAAGMAFGVVIASALNPSVANYFTDRMGYGTVEQAHYTERDGYVSASVKAFTAAELKYEALIVARENAANWNQKLNHALESMADLHSELSVMIVEGASMKPSEQLSMIRSVSSDWVRALSLEMAEMDTPALDWVQTVPISFSGTFVIRDFAAEAKLLEMENSFLSDMVEALGEDNAMVEESLREIQQSLLVVEREAAADVVDFDAAIDAIERYTTAIHRHYEPSPAAVAALGLDKEVDDVARLIGELEASPAR